MKKIVEIDTKEGLESLLGEEVLLMCANYFYAGKLVGVNRSVVKLSNARLVYETGTWDKAAWADAQKLPGDVYVRIPAIESFMRGKP